MVVGDKGEEDEIIPATPEPSVGEFRNYRANRPEQTGKHARVLNFDNDNLDSRGNQEVVGGDDKTDDLPPH